MGMAYPDNWPESIKLVVELKLERADPEEGLTCLFCWGGSCEWDTTLRLNGRTITVGVHEVCRERLETRFGV